MNPLTLDQVIYIKSSQLMSVSTCRFVSAILLGITFSSGNIQTLGYLGIKDE